MKGSHRKIPLSFFTGLLPGRIQWMNRKRLDGDRAALRFYGKAIPLGQDVSGGGDLAVVDEGLDGGAVHEDFDLADLALDGGWLVARLDRL